MIPSLLVIICSFVYVHLFLVLLFIPFLHAVLPLLDTLELRTNVFQSEDQFIAEITKLSSNLEFDHNHLAAMRESLSSIELKLAAAKELAYLSGH